MLTDFDAEVQAYDARGLQRSIGSRVHGQRELTRSAISDYR